MQKAEKCSIIKETKTLPFRLEVEHEDAMPTMSASATVKEKSFKTQVLVDAETGKSTVSAVVNLSVCGCAFLSDTATMVTDVFSVKNLLETNKEEVEYFHPKTLKTITGNLLARAGVEELPIGTSVLAVGNETVEIVGTETLVDGIKLIGEFSCTVYCSDADGVLKTKKLSTPFEKTFDGAIENGCLVGEIKLVVEKSSARIVSATEMELEIQLVLTVYSEEKKGLSFLKEVVITGEKSENPHAISVYIPMEGEELFSLAKRLNACPSALVSANPELTFPLTGNERIVVYRQK